MTDIQKRKEEHLNLALDQSHQSKGGEHFDEICFEPLAIPEIDLASVNIETTFLGHQCSAPIIIGAMTGGCDYSDIINKNLAIAAEVCRVPMALGSQRASLELGLPQKIRCWAPSTVLLGNLGGTQLAFGGTDLAKQAIESIEADGLMIHLNPLQELSQPNGDHNWCGVLNAIEKCCSQLNIPILVKEVGVGIGPTAARHLLSTGVEWLETAGFGGTNWTTIELARNNSYREREIMQPFITWGMSTCEVLFELSKLDEPLNLIASGGVRHGLDVARCIRLGAKMAAIAQPFLSPAIDSSSAVVEKIEIVSEQIKRTMFLTGKISLEELKEANLLRPQRLKKL
ncbi:MAG: type 2 isopentenyl-diphosphate Delta-isomerase [Cellvibrionales bacterium TMED49]|nr:type 2 isopentenyl-diphosphate Delta-isomerase [Porticoccaceae bacterium]OUU39000.1 MAG: type 2 isopentenyl-diphosphate Delta-isomerase [Cellvibrionales bacterium TMED49]